MPRVCSSLLLLLLIASPASAVMIDWTPIGNPGNACDPQPQGCFGSVGYTYNIGTYEVTNAQYAEFLNAKAASDPLELYEPTMAADFGGITRSGSSGSYSYSTIAGHENMPVNRMSFFNAIRFANWMNNGEGDGDTETGGYTLLGGTVIPSNGYTVTRNAGATIVLPTENEWFKAAYYSAITTSYFDYPAGSNTPTTCSTPTATPNRANCYPTGAGEFTPKGSYTGSASPYGTFDQGGNINEWNETIINCASFGQTGLCRMFRGGGMGDTSSALAASSRRDFDPKFESQVVGFRLVMIPEPGTGLLVVVGLVGLAGWRRGRA